MSDEDDDVEETEDEEDDDEHTFDVYVVNSKGEPVPDVRVYAEWGALLGVSPNYRTDDDGHVEIERPMGMLGRGTWVTLSVEDAEGEDYTVDDDDSITIEYDEEDEDED